MNHLKTNHSCSSHCLPVWVTLAALAVLALASIPVARASEDNRAPDLPSPLCDRLQVQGGRVALHVYALGVQIYRWNGTSWDFVGPSARVNTAGGLPPTAPGAYIGAEEEVPYTAEYYFYRAQD
jgi:Protein of unknown function (DUF3455)